MTNFKRVPHAFLWTLLLIVLTEFFVYSNRESLVHDYWNKFVINEKVLAEAPGDYDYLILGNSIQKTGIRPADVSDRLLSIGLAGAKPLAQVALLKRYLRKHKPPKVIFLYVDPENQYDTMQVIARYFFDFTEFGTYASDLSRDERDAYVWKMFSTLDHRKVGLGQDRVAYGGPNAEFVRALLANRGFMQSPFHDRILADDFYATHKTHRRIQPSITIEPRDRKYFDELMTVADQSGIRVVFLGMVVPEELGAIFETNGFFKEYREYLAALRARYPRVTLPGGETFGIANKYFGDFQHMNDQGVEFYTRYFKEEVFAPTVASAAAER